jgi:hypothetical protein
MLLANLTHWPEGNRSLIYSSVHFLTNSFSFSQEVKAFCKRVKENVKVYIPPNCSSVSWTPYKRGRWANPFFHFLSWISFFSCFFSLLQIRSMEKSSVFTNTDSLTWQAQILQNVSQVAEGRKLFAERGKGLISRVLPLIPALRFPPHLMCRRSVRESMRVWFFFLRLLMFLYLPLLLLLVKILGLMRNCAFEDSSHEWLVKEQNLMAVVRLGKRKK